MARRLVNMSTRAQGVPDAWRVSACLQVVSSPVRCQRACRLSILEGETGSTLYLSPVVGENGRVIAKFATTAATESSTVAKFATVQKGDSSSPTRPSTTSGRRSRTWASRSSRSRASSRPPRRSLHKSATFPPDSAALAHGNRVQVDERV